MSQPFASLLPGMDQRSSFDSHSDRTHSDRDTQVGLLDGGATSGGGTPLRTPVLQEAGTPLQARLATLDSAIPAAQLKPASQTGFASLGPSSQTGFASMASQRKPISQTGLASVTTETGFASMTSASPAALDISFASAMPVSQSGVAAVAQAPCSTSPASMSPGPRIVQSSELAACSTSPASMIPGSRIVQNSEILQPATVASSAGYLLPHERSTPQSMPASTGLSSSPRVKVTETGLASLVAESASGVAEFGSKVAAPEGGEDPFGVYETLPPQVPLHTDQEVPLQSQFSLGEALSPASIKAPSTVASLSPTLLGETTSFASKAPNPLGRMRRLMQDLELQKLERDAAMQQEARLRDRLELLERIAGVHAGEIDGLENLAAWRLVPGMKEGYFVDADRVPDREAELLQKEQSKTISVAFAEVLAGKPTARGKALIQEEAQHVFQEGEHVMEDVLKSLDKNMEVMTDD